MTGLKKIGEVKLKHSSDVHHSKIGIGFEKLDRDVFDPEKAYDKVAALGVKWVRIQSGWARTEKEKGVYDFSWIDSIVDNLVKRGLQPWICLCYGNGLYDEMAAKVFGAVGCPPIHNDEDRAAWAEYVKALVSRFKGKISYYEVWNEPDGKWCWKHGVSGEEYGRFAIATSQAVKSADPNAKVIGGSICITDLDFINKAFSVGMGDHIDALTFHEYTPSESSVFRKVKLLKALASMYNPKIEIIQGESGSQSRSDGAGALAGGSWTPRKQTKQLARHTIADLLSGVKFTSYFSCMDMIEALNGTVGDKSSYLDYGYFGVLGADFDENGFATGEYTPKPSYYALGTIASIFAEDFEVAELPIMLKVLPSRFTLGTDIGQDSIISGGFRKPNGSYAFAYWKPSNLMTEEYEGTISLQYAAVKGGLKLVSLYDGSIYEIPESSIESQGNGCYLVKHLPITDYPLLLTFGDFI